jgi:hypothetical protein
VIKTFHNTMLVFDVLRNQCAHGESVDKYRPAVQMEIFGDEARLFVRVGASKLFLGVDGESVSLLGNDKTSGQFHVTSFNARHFLIHSGGIHMCAEPDDAVVVVNRKAASDWECFRFDVADPPADP